MSLKTPGTAASAAGKEIEITAPLTVVELAEKLGVSPVSVQQDLMRLGVLANLNQQVSVEHATRVAQGRGFQVRAGDGRAAAVAPGAAPTLAGKAPRRPRPAGPVPRPPVVVIMGHVDHGKTSLLDAIRRTDVAAHEYGGITQHIGAFQVDVEAGTDQEGRKLYRKITFLDTPGHEAFTAMRARGAQVADIAVLVVAADDGVMPQTIEAIDHARAAGLQIIVAINKIDKEDANPQRVLQQLAEHGLVAEDWGGDIVTVEVSATQNLGIDDLLEYILLVAETLELTADPTGPAEGTIIEARRDPHKGPTATVLVQSGTLLVGDAVVAGTTCGKIKAMTDERGRRLNRATPSTPVEILGLDDVPIAGDTLTVVENERVARQVVEQRLEEERRRRAERVRTLEEMMERLRRGELKELNVILKADVHGSVEAVRDALLKLSTDEVEVRIISAGVGNITESDVMLAAASDAIIIGFNVKADSAARRAAHDERVEIRTYRIIYELIDAVRAALSGLLAPILREVVLGRAEVRATFRLPSGQIVAGCYVQDGRMVRGADVRVLRGGQVIHDGSIDSLRHLRENVREIAAGYECGILIDGFNDFQVGDVLEAYQTEQVARELR